MNYQNGNLNNMVEENSQYRGWVVGAFIDPESFFHTEGVEVKWAFHKKGKRKAGSKSDYETRSMTILLKGKFKFELLDCAGEIEESYVLKNMGDYVAYDTSKVGHNVEALEDSQVIVIRWPSRAQQ